MGGATGGKRIKCAGDAPPHGEFPAAGCGCGGFHTFERCSRECSSNPLCRALIWESFGSGFMWGAALSVASVGIEDEDGTVFAADLDRLAGVGALVEQVAALLRIVVGNPFPDGLPRRLDGFEGLDVEGRVGWRREVEDALPEAVEPEEELDFAGADDGRLGCGRWRRRGSRWLGRLQSSAWCANCGVSAIRVGS